MHVAWNRSRTGGNLVERASESAEPHMPSPIEGEGTLSLVSAAFDSLQSPVAIIDQHGRIVVTNEAWRRFGRENGLVDASAAGPGINYLAVCEKAQGADAEIARAVAVGIRQVIAGEQALFAVEYPCHGPSQKRWFVLHATRVIDKGSPYAVLAHHDISPIRLAEEQQRATEERLRSLVEEAQDAIFRFRIRPAPRFDYVSSAISLLTGYTQEEHYANPELGMCLILQQYQSELESRIGNLNSSSRPIVLPVQHRDGSTHWAELRVHAVYDDAGQILALQGIARDITGRKEAEEELRESERKHRELMEQASDGIVVADPHDVVLDVNPVMCIMLGYTRQELVGKSMAALIHPEDLERTPLQANVERVGPGEIAHYERVLLRKDGTTFVAEVSARKLKNGRIQGIFRDITSRKESEQLLREYAATQTHLLRRLMTAEEAERRRLSIEIHDGPLQSIGVALMALDRARMRRDRGESEKADEELSMLRNVMQGTVAELRSILADLSQDALFNYGLENALANHIERFTTMTGIRVNLDYRIPWKLPQQMKLVLYRLAQEALSNIRKHAEANVASVEVWSSDDEIHMRISDDGRGFDLPTVLQQHIEGHKIGLTSMRERALAAGGDLSIKATPGEGTTLEFWCPAHPRTSTSGLPSLAEDLVP